MDSKAEKNLILRISEYGLEHDEFTLTDLLKDLGIGFEGHSYSYVWNSLVSQTPQTNNPNHVIILVKERVVLYENRPVSYIDHGALFRLTPTAIFNYIDYLEIVEARKAANDAKQQSSLAIQLSAFSIIIAVLFGLLGAILTVVQIIKD